MRSDLSTDSSASAWALHAYLLRARVAELADQLGVAPETVRSWRRGTNIPRADHASRLQVLTHGAVPADGWARARD